LSFLRLYPTFYHTQAKNQGFQGSGDTVNHAILCAPCGAAGCTVDTGAASSLAPVVIGAGADHSSIVTSDAGPVLGIQGAAILALGIQSGAGLPMRIEPFTPHQLRHTFCTLMYFAGVDVLTARDQMGHKDISVTLGIYTSLDKKFKKKKINRLDSYLKKQTG